MRPALCALLLALAALAACAPSLGSAAKTPRQGLNVGTVPNPFDGTDTGKDVVKNGTLLSWTVGEPYTVETLVNYVDLFLSLDLVDGWDNTQELDVIWTTDDTFALRVFLEGEELQQGSPVVLRHGYQQQRRLHAEIACTNRSKTGRADVELLIANHTTLPMTFQYNCTNALNYSFDFFASSSQDPKGGVDWIAHGRTVEDAKTVVDEDTDRLEVWTYLDSFAPHNRTVEYFVAVDWDEIYVKVSTPDAPGVAREDKRTLLPIKLECNEDFHLNDTFTTLITVTFLFNDPDTEDASFNFEKTCSYIKTDGGGGGGGGWSPFGIFCFTVFIISLVFCTAGCAVNRFHFHKQGADIIPGMPLYRRCLGRPTGVYTPQADFNDDPATAGSTYGSYQENL